MRLDDTPIFSRVRVKAAGSINTAETKSFEGVDVIIWTSLESSDDVFAEVDMRGVLISDSELCWMAGDTEVQMIEPPHFAGQPEELLKQATPVASPKGSSAHFDTSEGWPDLIWASPTLLHAIKSYHDYGPSVEVLLCALAVAPDVGDLRPMLLAGLKANYARVSRHPDVYDQPWRTKKKPDDALLGILRL